MKKALSVFVCIGLLFFGWQLHENRIVKVKVPTLQDPGFFIKMPWKDRKKLTYLFYKMVILDSGGYTLFGSKAIYMDGGIKPFSFSDWYSFQVSLSPHNIRMHQGWKTWQRYERLFKNSNFLLLVEKNPFGPELRSQMCILIINRSKFNEIVHLYKKDFVDVLQRNDISGEMLLKETKAKPLLKIVLKGHDGLIGTLFGFGRNNAWKFEEKKNSKQICLAPIWEQKIYDFLDNRPDGVCLDDLPSVLGYPTFLAEPNTPESEALKREFTNVRNKILEYYKGKEFLEATLSLLAGDPVYDQQGL